jgi:hypothetical protein
LQSTDVAGSKLLVRQRSDSHACIIGDGVSLAQVADNRRLSMMFETFYFEHPQDETRRVNVSAAGYVMAGLTGSLYVLWKAGWAGFVAAVLPHLLTILALIAATGVTSLLLPETQQLVVLAIGVPALSVFQAIYMIRIISRTYTDRGWTVHST